MNHQVSIRNMSFLYVSLVYYVICVRPSPEVVFMFSWEEKNKKVVEWPRVLELLSYTHCQAFLYIYNMVENLNPGWLDEHVSDFRPSARLLTSRTMYIL